MGLSLSIYQDFTFKDNSHSAGSLYSRELHLCLPQVKDSPLLSDCLPWCAPSTALQVVAVTPGQSCIFFSDVPPGLQHLQSPMRSAHIKECLILLNC